MELCRNCNHGTDICTDRDCCDLCTHGQGEIVATPNLDAMTADDLLTFAAAALGRGQTQVLLGRYAITRAAAMAHRLRGEISAALRLERECDTIYQALPVEVQW